MKKIFNIQYIAFALLASCFVTSHAQTYSEDSSQEDETTQIETSASENILNSFGFSSQSNSTSRNNLIEGSSVFVRQVGEFNQARVAVIANASDINLIQNGDENLTNLEYDVNTASANLLQNGNNNRIVDFVYNKSANISLDLEQEGDNITFERFGSNNITESLKFKQTEASPTIIVRSFN